MVKYIAHFDLSNHGGKRNCFLSATNKIQYIVDTISKQGQKVEILSASNATKASCKKEKIWLGNNVLLYLLHGFRRGNKFTNIVSTVLFNLNMFVFLLFHLHRKDLVIVYHSLVLMRIVAILKRIKGFHLTIEAEEIYSDVTNNYKKRKKEIEFLNLADAYLFPTELMDEVINTGKKPSTIIYGTYRVEFDRNLTGENVFLHKGDEERIIHCVYAGTFDPQKGGASAAVAAAEFLPSNYHIHIIGFGTESDKRHLLKAIEEISEKECAKVSFDGLLSGEEYIRFIQSCDIGLSTQNPNAAFNNSSFPSKILSYMANGLRVVSIRIPAVERSKIGGSVYYYEKHDPRDIAKAILNVDLQDEYDGRKIIAQLDCAFTEEIGQFLGKTCG